MRKRQEALGTHGNAVRSRLEFEGAIGRTSHLVVINRDDGIYRRIGRDRQLSRKLAHFNQDSSARRLVHFKRLRHVVITFFGGVYGVSPLPHQGAIAQG